MSRLPPLNLLTINAHSFRSRHELKLLTFAHSTSTPQRPNSALRGSRESYIQRAHSPLGITKLTREVKLSLYCWELVID